MARPVIISTSFTQPTILQTKEGKVGWIKWILKLPTPQGVNTETNKQKTNGFGPIEEVMLEVMTEVMSAETAHFKWSEVFFIIVYFDTLTTDGMFSGQRFAILAMFKGILH